jgi:hypothetical protein
MKNFTKDEIKVSVFLKLKQELKKAGINVADSYISKDRDYGYIKGIPEESDEEIDIAVEVVSQSTIEGKTFTKTAFNLKDRDYEFNADGDLTELAQDFYVIASFGKKISSFYIYSKDEMQSIINSGITSNLVKSQLSKTASSQSIYNLELDNFTKPEYENKWSKLLKK